MSSALRPLLENTAYFFVAMGVVWLGVAAFTGSYLLLWPVLACVVAGLLLKLRPGRRFTWSWAVASAALGLLLAGYEVYVWSPFVGGAFSALAAEAVAVFGALAVVHVVLVYAGWVRPGAAKPAQT